MAYGDSVYYPRTQNISVSSPAKRIPAIQNKKTAESSRDIKRESTSSGKTVLNEAEHNISSNDKDTARGNVDNPILKNDFMLNIPEFKGSNYKKKFEASVQALSQLKHQNKAWRDVAENRFILLQQALNRVDGLKQQLKAISYAVLDENDIAYLNSSVPCSTDGIGITTQIMSEVEICKEYSNLLYDRIKSADDSIAHLAHLVEEEMHDIPVAHIDLEIPSHMLSSKDLSEKTGCSEVFGGRNCDESASLFSEFETNYSRYGNNDISQERFSSIADPSDDFLV